MERSARGRGYRPFPNITRRNITQEFLEVPLLVAAMKISPGLRMLEVGCGRGVALPPLARLCRPNALVGIDIEPEFILEARARLRARQVQATVKTADVRDLPFENGCFDVVIDFGTCFHIAEPERALAEIERVLVPGGRFVSETRLGQLLSHPVRSRHRSVPWEGRPSLRLEFHRLLWDSHRKVPLPLDRLKPAALPSGIQGEHQPDSDRDLVPPVRPHVYGGVRVDS